MMSLCPRCNPPGLQALAACLDSEQDPTPNPLFPQLPTHSTLTFKGLLMSFPPCLDLSFSSPLLCQEMTTAFRCASIVAIIINNRDHWSGIIQAYHLEQQKAVVCLACVLGVPFTLHVSLCFYIPLLPLCCQLFYITLQHHSGFGMYTNSMIQMTNFTN